MNPHVDEQCTLYDTDIIWIWGAGILLTVLAGVLALFGNFDQAWGAFAIGFGVKMVAAGLGTLMRIRSKNETVR